MCDRVNGVNPLSLLVDRGHSAMFLYRERFFLFHTLVLGFVIASGRLKYSNLFGHCIREEVEVIFLGILLLPCVFYRGYR